MYYYSIKSLVYYARNKYTINIDNNLKAGSRVMFEITGEIIIDTDFDNWSYLLLHFNKTKQC